MRGRGISQRLLRRADLCEPVAGGGPRGGSCGQRASGRAPWHAGAGSCGRAPWHAGAGSSCGRALRSLERGFAAAVAASARAGAGAAAGVGAAVAASVRAGAGAAAGVGCESRACVAGAGAVYTAPLIDSRDKARGVAHVVTLGQLRGGVGQGSCPVGFFSFFSFYFPVSFLFHLSNSNMVLKFKLALNA
jgi:hypothetical protein